VIGGNYLLIFFLLTLLSYLSIDFAVYWIGKDVDLNNFQVTMHHLKMLPVYLIANIFISIGFITGIKNGGSPLFLISASMFVWTICLLIIGAIIYKQIPGWLTLVGFIVIIAGILIIQMDLSRQ